MGSAAGIIAEAKRWVGWKSGYSMNAFNKWYADKKGGAGYYNYHAWCDEFVSYCADVTGNADVVGCDAYTPRHANWFKAQGRWRGKGTTPVPGQIVFFDWEQNGEIDHVGLVVAVNGGTITTIEGNTNAYPGMVAYQYHSIWAGYIAGYGNPAYSGAKPKEWDKGIIYAGKDRVDTCNKVAATRNTKAVIKAKANSPWDLVTGMKVAGRLGAKVLMVNDDRQALYTYNAKTGKDRIRFFMGSDDRFITNQEYHATMAARGFARSNTAIVIEADRTQAPEAILAAWHSYVKGSDVLLYKKGSDFDYEVSLYEEVIVLGGNLPKIKGETLRIAGKTREETAYKFYKRYASNPTHANFCRFDGENWADGVAASQLMGPNPPMPFYGAWTEKLLKEYPSIKTPVWFGGGTISDYARCEKLTKLIG